MLFRKSSWTRSRRAAAAIAFCCATWPATTSFGQVGGDFDIDNLTDAAPPDAATSTEGTAPADTGAPPDAAGPETITAEEVFNAAERLRANGNWTEAIREYGKILSREPRHAPSAIGAAKCFSELQEYDSAIEMLSTAVGANPGNLELLHTRGTIYLLANKYNEALEDFSAGTKLDPVNADMLFLRGKAQLRVGQSLLQEQDSDANIAIGQAIGSFDRALKYKDDLAEAYFERGTAYSITRNSEPALDDFRKAVALDEANVKYKVQLGFAELTMGSELAARTTPNTDLVIGHYRSALTAMDQYLAANPVADRAGYREMVRNSKPEDIPVTRVMLTQSSARVELAKLVPAADRATLYEQAIADCNRVLELDEMAYGALFQRGVVERLTGQFDRALVSLREAAEIAGESPELLLRRGIIFFHQGELSMALHDFTRAVDGSPQPDPRAAFWAGAVQAKQGNLLEAIRRYSAAIRENPNYLPALNNRGMAYMEVGLYDRAVEDFDRVLALKGENATIRARRDQAARLADGN